MKNSRLRLRAALVLPPLALMLLFCGESAATADELAVKGREIFSKHQHAVLTVQVVVKASNGSGRSSESRQEVTGTVVDPSGLTVLALSQCDPAELYRRLSSESRLEVEVTDIKMLLQDGSELPAEIVLRDRDLDLAFIRPKTKPAKPMASVSLADSAPAQVLDPIVTLNRLNKATSRAYAASIERVSALVERPRTFYVPDASMTTTTLGSPAFLPDGKLVGIFVIRAVSATDGDVRQSYTSIILPAEDVLNAAKQAPERGPDTRKEPAPAGESAGSSTSN